MYYDHMDPSGLPIVLLHGQLRQYMIKSDKDVSSSVDDLDWKHRINTRIDNPYDIGKWADENFNGAYIIGIRVSTFMEEDDAILFKLMWGFG